jgi:hypothetical protein
MNTISDQINVIRAWASTASENSAMNKDDLRFVLQNVSVELLKVQQSMATTSKSVAVDRFAIASRLQRAQRSYANGDKLKSLDNDAMLDAMTDAMCALLAQPQQPVAPIGVELAGVRGELLSLVDHLAGLHDSGEQFNALEVVTILRLVLSDLEKLLALPQTEKGEGFEQVGWYDPDEPSKVWNMDTHDDDLSEFHSPLYAIRSEVRGPEFCGGMVEGQCLCTIPCSIFKTPQDAGKVKP